MAKNLISQIAKMLNVEIGEDFEIKNRHGELISDKTYKFSENALLYCYQDDDVCYTASRTTLQSLLNGKYEIVKIPWKPKVGEEYYSFIVKGADNPYLHVCCEKWNERLDDWAMFKAGWIYRTKEEVQAILPYVANLLHIKYEL